MAGWFSQQTLEQIRAASDIVEVIGSYLPLKRAGANFVALCPFHHEKTPSFNVHPQKQIFHCFGCHKGGDVFTFVKEFENVDFPEAVKRLADRAKIPLAYEQGGSDQKARHVKESLLQIHEQIAQRWQGALATEAAGQAARDYLARRGVSAEAIKLFRLGFAPDLWDDTVNWAKSKGHELALVETAGLILRKETGEGFYDRFRGRLMFPICDEQGRVIAFSGRILDPEAKAAKYVNSPETPIFTKSKVFYGLDKSKRAILDAGFAIVCEGQLDLIACFMAGAQNMVAPQGTAFTSEHARILKRYVEEVVLCFDSDEAGQNAAVRSLDSLLASGLAVRVAVVPPPHDPDSFIKASGPAAFKDLIAKAEGFFDYYLNRLCAGNGVTTDRGRAAVLEGMAEAIQKTGNLVVLDTYARKTALRLGVSAESVRAEFEKLSRSKPRLPRPDGEASAPASEPAGAPTVTPVSSHERWLLKLLFGHEELADWTCLHLDPEWVPHPAVRQVVTQRLQAHRNQTWSNFAAFLTECSAPELLSLITEATADPRPLPNAEQQLADVVLRLRNRFIDARLSQLLQRSSQPGVSDSEGLDLLHQQQELRNLKRQPLMELPAPQPEGLKESSRGSKRSEDPR